MKSFQEIANFDVEQLVNKFSGEVMQITKIFLLVYLDWLLLFHIL